MAEPPVITLFASSSPKPSEILGLLLTRPGIGVSLLKFGALGAVPATAAARRGDMDAAMRIFGQAVLGREYFHRLSLSRMEQVQANAIPAEFLGSGFPRLNEESVRKIQMPTLLVTGDASPRLFHRLINRLENLLPHARKVQIAGASHIMHEDNAPAFNAAVLSFLATHGGDGRATCAM